MRRTIALFLSVFLLGLSDVAGAQVLIYFDCTVDKVREFRGLVADFYTGLVDSERPTVFVDDWTYSDGELGSHRILFAYPDYKSAEGLAPLIARSPDSRDALEAMQSVSTCKGPGLSVLRGSWGNQDAQASFFAVYNIAATDGRAYAAALARLAESQSAQAPGSILLLENRAGLSGVSHIVVLGAPSQSALNEYLDVLFASRDFELFADAVNTIRTVVSSSQAARVLVLTPDED